MFTLILQIICNFSAVIRHYGCIADIWKMSVKHSVIGYWKSGQFSIYVPDFADKAMVKGYGNSAAIPGKEHTAVEGAPVEYCVIITSNKKWLNIY